MKTLIYSPDEEVTRPLCRVFEQSNLWPDTCHAKEHFLVMSMTEVYAAVIVMNVGHLDDLLGLFKNWKTQGCSSIFVVLTNRQSGLERAKALESGIDRYLISPYSYSKLVTDITISQYRSELIERSTCKTQFFELDILARAVYCDNIQLTLTKIEFELISLLIRRRGIVLSRVQIWEEVWGYQEYSLANTIDVHINRLRRKLPANRRELIRTIFGVGYRMHEQA